MKISRKKDMDVADEMIFNLVSRRSITCKVCLNTLICPLRCSKGRIGMKICIKEDIGVVVEITSSTIKRL